MTNEWKDIKHAPKGVWKVIFKKETKWCRKTKSHVETGNYVLDSKHTYHTPKRIITKQGKFVTESYWMPPVFDKAIKDEKNLDGDRWNNYNKDSGPTHWQYLPEA